MLIFWKTSLVLPNELSETIFLMINDVCLNEVYGNQYLSLMCPILSYLEPKLYDAYVMSNRICESLNAACNFLIGFENSSVVIIFSFSILAEILANWLISFFSNQMNCSILHNSRYTASIITCVNWYRKKQSRYVLIWCPASIWTKISSIKPKLRMCYRFAWWTQMRIFALKLTGKS